MGKVASDASLAAADTRRRAAERRGTTPRATRTTHPSPHRLVIKHFAQLADVNITLGDLTVLVGAQGTGKSLTLQWLKAALDGRDIIETLKEAGQTPTDEAQTIDLIFGAGMRGAWSSASEVHFDGHRVEPSPARLGGRRERRERCFYIPAHRALLVSDGWAAPFQKCPAAMPIVARMFSQAMYQQFTDFGDTHLFPLPRVLKDVYRKMIDSAVFHGGTVGLRQDAQLAKRLTMQHGKTALAFMAWTAGQREFLPLLLGLYRLLPARAQAKRADVDVVVIEEPEMGLHPQAVSVVMLLVLELLARGYRVVLSSHSPDVITAVWMLQRLASYRAPWQRVCEAFGQAPVEQLQKVTSTALKAKFCVFALTYGEAGKVVSADISSLDPEAHDATTGEWGGLTAFSSRYGMAVREAANAAVP